MKEIKVKELYLINELDQKCEMLLNHNINNEFYGYYFNNSIEWLLENKEKINKDFYNNINGLRFDIVLNSNLDERVDIILNINDLYDFSKYVHFVPFDYLKKRQKNKVVKQFNEFMNMKSNYSKLQYFDIIRRK